MTSNPAWLSILQLHVGNNDFCKIYAAPHLQQHLAEPLGSVGEVCRMTTERDIIICCLVLNPGGLENVLRFEPITNEHLQLR